ncbi:lysosomal alpha-glucosidase-like protein [Leptotrombidium deliense]|uniref:Lysosomal alpha-glucosidase-like protein n=1 Tax=Leptotrombidium deliense TaxID=299467 RepID=A0A443RSZ6_9ACAR|nr:lysosomal alpha-glucosidase-like protein [Leptotrombidium deliense]
MWGSHILIIPVLQQGATSVNGYLPAGRWWTWNTTSLLNSRGETFNFKTEIDEINIFVREAAIIPSSDKVMITKELQDSNFNLLITLDEHSEANGELFWDDGDLADSQQKGKYNLMQFKVQQNTLIANPMQLGYKIEKYVSSITNCGVKAKPKEVYVNQETISFDFNDVSMFRSTAE